MADQVSQKLLDRYKMVTTATVYSGVRRLGYEPSFMVDVHPFTPGARLAGRARTLRFLPQRLDIRREAQRGEDSPEYRATGSCRPGDVLVCDALGRGYASIGGDVKLLQLKMARAEGIVSDGAIRDLEIVRGYGLKLFARGRTPTAGDMVAYEENVTIQCGGVVVRPGDVIVGDDDGVVVVPEQVATEVIDWVEEHEQVEEYVKGLIQKENVAPGKYYPPTDETVRRYRESRPR